MRDGNQPSIQKANRKGEKRPPPYNCKLRKDQCRRNEIIDGINALVGRNETVGARQLYRRKRSRDKKYDEKSYGNSERLPDLATRWWQRGKQELLFRRCEHDRPP